MATEEIVRYAMSFFGGGFVVAVGNWFFSAWSFRKAQEINQLRDQLQSLYGPLFFFTSQNEKLFEINNKIHDAYKNEFIDKNWSPDQLTRQRVKGQAEATIAIANDYIARAVRNNDRVMQIMEAQWHLLDPDDILIFSQFQVDYVRLQEELRDKAQMRTPDAIYDSLGAISYMRPEFISRVKGQFESKRARLAELLRPWWRCHSYRTARKPARLSSS